VAIFGFLKGGDEKDRFADQVMARLKERGWSKPLSYDRERFEVLTGGDIGRLYLGGIFRGVREAPPWKRKEPLDNALDGFFDPDDEVSYGAAAPTLIPYIRNRARLGAMHLYSPGSLDAEAHMGVLGVLADSLVVQVVRLRPQGVRVVTDRQLAIWGVSGQEVLQTAIENLRARSQAAFEKGPNGYFIARFGDDFDSSRLLLPELFADLQLQGRPVAVAFAQNGMVVVGSEEPKPQEALAAFVRGILTSQDITSVSNTPLVLAGGAWEPFMPEAPEYAPMRIMATNQRLWEYSDQAILLQDYLDRNGENWTLADAECLDDDAELRTWTSWKRTSRPCCPARTPSRWCISPAAPWSGGGRMWRRSAARSPSTGGATRRDTAPSAGPRPKPGSG
jgi:hypothetical protein